MQRDTASPVARKLEVGSDESYHGLNPSWSGREIVVYHVTREYATVAMEQYDDNHIKPFAFGVKAGNFADLSNYEAVAKIEYKWVIDEVPPFGITQNGFDSWSKDRDGVEQDCHTLTVLKPLVDGWGHKSTSVGDLLHDTTTNRWYVVDSCGYTRLKVVA